jgi:hypothetical protein
MKVYQVVIACVCFWGCGHKDSQETSNPLDSVRNKGNFYLQNITEDIYKERCDKLTFKALLSVVVPQNVANLEVAAGKWVRDVPDCYPSESASEVSNEGIISVMHHILTTKDCAAANRLLNYGKNNDWIMGEGDTANTDALVLSPFIKQLRDKVCGQGLALTENNDLDSVLKGYRGHILASFIWLRGRMNEGINNLEKNSLAKLVDASPGDPMYLALKARYNDGDQTQAIDILMNSEEFPGDSIPMQTGVFGWGSCPSMAYFLYVQAILEGK